jgi:hypothetical protein
LTNPTPPPTGEPALPPNDRQTAPHPRPGPPVPAVHIEGTVGGDVAGGDLNKELNAGRDIVGRDVVTSTNTTNVGFSAAMVQRLIVTVGALVAATAACFFLLGSVAAVGVVTALQRPVNTNNPAAAASFEANLAALRALPPGQAYAFSFTEEEISSYFHQIVEPSLNGEVMDGQVRLLDGRHLTLSGRARQLGWLQFAATFAWQKNEPGESLKLTGVLLHLLPLGDSPLGWVSLPPAALQPVESMLNSLFGNVEIVDVQPLPQGHAWAVSVLGH